LGHARLDVVGVLEVRGDALQAADRDGFGLLEVGVLHAAAAAGGLARPVARSPEDAGEDVGHPVDHVGVAVATLRDHADVFGDGRMGRAGPLAIDDLVEVGRGRVICALQAFASLARTETSWAPRGSLRPARKVTLLGLPRDSRTRPRLQVRARRSKAETTSGGAWTSSISTPSPPMGLSSLPFGCTKQMSKPAAPFRMPPGAKRTPCRLSHSTALGRSSIHRPMWFKGV